jgi:hypothetical protein
MIGQFTLFGGTNYAAAEIEFDSSTVCRKRLDEDVECWPCPFVSQDEVRLLARVGSGETGLRRFHSDRQYGHDRRFILTVCRSHQFSSCFILMLCLVYEFCRDIILPLRLFHESQRCFVLALCLI